MTGIFGGEEGPGAATCSAKGCRHEAAFVLVWNNPKIHTAERRKTWLACEAHRQQLADFLTARGFLKEVLPIEDHLAQRGPAGSSSSTVRGGDQVPSAPVSAD